MSEGYTLLELVGSVLFVTFIVGAGYLGLRLVFALIHFLEAAS